MSRCFHSVLGLSLVWVLGGAVGPALALAQSAGGTQQQVEQRKANAARLLEQGIEQYQVSQFEAALQSWQQALEIYREIKDRLAEGITLANLGGVYYILGNYPKMIEFQEQSLTIARELKNRRSEGQSLGNLGIAYDSLGNYPKAIELYEQDLAIKRELKDRHGEGQSLGNLGGTYRDLGNYPKAIELHEQSLAIARELKDRHGEGESLGNLGNVYFLLGNYPKAIELHKKHLAIAREIKDQDGEGQSLGNLGGAYYTLGNYPKAIEFYEESLAIARKIKGRRGEGIALANLGIVYRALGNYPKAIELHEQSLAIKREIKDQLGEEQSLGNLGNTYDDLGNHLKAIELLEKSLTIARKIKDRHGEGQSLSNLGIAYDASGNYLKAIEFYGQSLAIAQEIKDQLGEEETLGNLGIAYNSLGNYPKAIELHEQSLAIALKIKHRLGEGNTLASLGDAHDALGNYPKAIELYEQSLAIARELKDRSSEGRSLSKLGNILANQHQPELAIAFYKQSVKVREAIRTTNRPLDRSLQSSYTQTVAGTYQALADLLLQQNRVTEALQVLDLLKAQDLQDFLRDVKGNPLTAKGLELTPKEASLFQTLIAAPIDLNNLPKPTPQNGSTANSDLNLPAYQDLQARLHKLGHNSALLYPLVLDDRLELVLLLPDKAPIHKSVPIPRKTLEAAIEKFRTVLANPEIPAQVPAQELYTSLIQPLEADLKDANIKTLLYAPDGQMRYIPLAALHDGKQWLAQRFQVNYLTALALTQLDPDPTADPHVLAAARTSDLQYSRPEVENLAKDFTNTTTLFGEQFNRDSLISGIPKNSIIHLATHATFGGTPDTSYIKLGNQDTITLRELDKINFGQASLVVLSACQTAQANASQGLEILGFGYQLQRAHVRAGIASLWSVNDGGTQILMNAFYGALKTGKYSKVEALSEAQKALITGNFQAVGGKRNPGEIGIQLSPAAQAAAQANLSHNLNHPFYWAPFILIGNGL